MPEAEIRNSVDQDAQIKLLREKIVQEDELLNSRVNIPCAAWPFANCGRSV